MKVDTAARLVPASFVVGVFILVTGLWRTPDDGPVQRVVVDDGDGSVLIDIDVENPTERFPWETETVGMVSALVEGGLSSLHSVTARIDKAPVAPGLEVATSPEIWTGSLRLEGEREDLTAILEVCDPTRRCRTFTGRGGYLQPEDMARPLVEGVGQLLGRDTTLATAWTVQQSRDHYARLVGGRAAAIWYGWSEPPSARDKGSVIRDPIRRTIYLDPNQPVGKWFVARRAVRERDWSTADNALRRGAEEAPGAVLDVIHAVVLMQSGTPEDALEKFARLGTTLGDDPRMVFSQIEALMVSGNPGEATRRLDALGEAIQDAPRALELRARIELAQGEVPNPDGLLARWQEQAPWDPEPVRLRIEALVDQGRFAEALDLTRDLERAGAAAQARALRLALAAELEDWPRAARTAEEIDEELGDAIRQLSGTRRDGRGADDDRFGPDVLVHQARRDLDEGQVHNALIEVRRAIECAPNHVDARLLQIEALERAGDHQAVAEARCALHRLHPGALGDPASAEMIALSARCGP